MESNLSWSERIVWLLFGAVIVLVGAYALLFNVKVALIVLGVGALTLTEGVLGWSWVRHVVR